AYLIGSIPVGYLLVRYVTGQNIRELGSGNIGSTNVKRIAGKKLAALTQILDMSKGLLPVGIYLYLTYNPVLNYFQNIQSGYWIYAIALASVLGHDFSLFLRFEGGKGVNTTLGASVLLSPFAVFISVAVYFVVKWRFKYVSLGSIVLSVSLVITQLLLEGVTPTFYYFIICMLLIILLHRKNIDRLLHNQELSS
ncbi:MAG: glycerol-3-phosphate 1-O-acyltransferase PlsY, partial [Plesiomonas sp.]